MTSTHQSPSREGRAPRSRYEAFGESACFASTGPRTLWATIGLCVLYALTVALLVAVMVLASGRDAHAAGSVLVGYMANQSGGRIELYSGPVPESVQRVEGACKGSLIAKSWSRDSSDTYGCWSTTADTIVIHWFALGGIDKTYLMSGFTPAVRRK